MKTDLAGARTRLRFFLPIFVLVADSLAFANSESSSGNVQVQGPVYVAAIPGDVFEGEFTSAREVFRSDSAHDLVSRFVKIAENTRLNWQSQPARSISFDSDSRFSLLKFDLINTGSRKESVVLDFMRIHGFGWSYLDHNGERHNHLDRFDQIAGGRELKDPTPVLELELEPGFTYEILLIAYNFQPTGRASLTLFSQDGFRQDRMNQHLIDGSFYGLIVTLAMMSLFLGFALRQMMYIYFAGFLFGSGGTLYFATGLSLVFGIENSFDQTMPFLNFCIGLVGLFSALFSMHLLNIRRGSSLYPTWSVLVFAYLMTIPIVVYLTRSGGFDEQNVNVGLGIAALVGILAQLTYVYTFIRFWKHSLVSRFWFFGVTAHTIILVSWPFMLDSEIVRYVDPPEFAKFWVALDSLFLSALVAFSFQAENKARQEAQKKSVEHLRVAHDVEKSKSSFVTRVGHDLRGPVQAISHFTRSMRAEAPEVSRRYADQIDVNLVSISVMLDGMVSLSKIEGHSSSPELREISLSRMIFELRDEFSAQVAVKGIRLEVDTDPCTVVSDRFCLGQILRNLIDNAIKYTDEGHVLISTREETDSIILVVEDTGCGIAESDRGKVFQEFFQVAGSHRDQGVGLGLSIASNLAQLLEISIDVESEFEKGSKFILMIPRNPAGSVLSSDEGASLPGSDITNRQGGLCLVGDLSNAMSETPDSFKEWSFDIAFASDTEAFARLLVSYANFSVIIINVDCYEDAIAQGLLKQGLAVIVWIPDDIDDNEIPAIDPSHLVTRVGLTPLKLRSMFQRVSVMPF